MGTEFAGRSTATRWEWASAIMGAGGPLRPVWMPKEDRSQHVAEDAPLAQATTHCVAKQLCQKGCAKWAAVARWRLVLTKGDPLLRVASYVRRIQHIPRTASRLRHRDEHHAGVTCVFPQ